MPNSYLPQLAARALGIYEAHGLEVEVVEPATGPRNLDAVSRGDYDLCMTSVPYYLWARDENPDLDARFVFVTSRRIHMTAFAIEGRPAVHGRPITSFADLAGASFAVRTELPAGVEGLSRQMTQVHQERLTRDYLALLSHLGVEPGPLVDVGLGSTLDAVVDGEADVCAEWIELGVAMAADAARKGLSLRSLRFADAGVPGYLNGFIAGGRVLRERPEALARFVAAVREAMIAVRDDPAPALELLAAELPDRDPATVLQRWRLGEPAMFEAGDLGVGTMDAAAWADSVGYHMRVNGTRPLDPASVYDLTPWELALSAR
jgi:ABC-type nitrate/sulfonate/bicarbonate transport system substrate-binding protein